jgi:hypothetical protein
MIMLGARDRTVRRRRSWREKATSCPDSGFRIVRSTKGITGSACGVGIFIVPWVDRSGKGKTWASRGSRGNNTRRKSRKGRIFRITTTL